jgi:hypothetical protein
MLIKFLDHGAGDGRSAAEYLLDALDHNGNRRESVRLLRGDPMQVAAVADSLNFKHRYTSGVIGWAPDDRPTERQIDHVLRVFERTAWAGLDDERYVWSAVEHRDAKGGVHVHIFAARVDLQTGKSLNIAPPGRIATGGARMLGSARIYDPLRDAFNLKFGWARPDDPAHQREYEPGRKAIIDADRLRKGLAVEPDSREYLTRIVKDQIKAGLIRNRDDIIAALTGLDLGLKLVRKGKDYITLMDPESGSRVRLKGALYDEDWQPGREAENTDRAKQSADHGRRKANPGDLERVVRELAQLRARRAAYHEKRYGANASTGLDPRADLGDGDLCGYLRRVLGADAIVGESYPRPGGADTAVQADACGLGDQDRGAGLATGIGRVDVDPSASGVEGQGELEKRGARGSARAQIPER